MNAPHSETNNNFNNNEDEGDPNHGAKSHASAALTSTPKKSATEYCQEFRDAQGWNKAGAAILGATCWFSDAHFLYVRPRLKRTDLALMAALTAVGMVFDFLMGAAVGVCIGGTWILWKLSAWKPVSQVRFPIRGIVRFPDLIFFF